jgi:hypothetical protein
VVLNDPNNPRNQFRTILAADPKTPAGYVLSGGSDGAQDIAPQSFVPGTASGGFPTYPINGQPLLTNLRNLDGTGSTGV